MLSFRTLMGAAGLGGDMGAVIKSIQYGEIAINDTDVSNTATINSVDLDKSFVMWLGSNCNVSNIERGTATVHFVDETTVQATRYDGVEGDALVVNFCAIEFESGVNVQRGSVIMTAVASNTKTINSVNVSKSVLFYAGFRCNDTSNVYSWRYQPRLELTDPTTVTATRERSANTVVVVFAVVEFL